MPSGLFSASKGKSSHGEKRLRPSRSHRLPPPPQIGLFKGGREQIPISVFTWRWPGRNEGSRCLHCAGTAGLSAPNERAEESGGGVRGGPHSRDGPGAAPLPAGPGLSAHPGGAGTEPSDKAPQKPEPPPAGGEAHTWPGATGASRCARTCPPPLLPTEPTLATVCGTDPPPDSGTRPPPVVRHRGGQGRAGDALRCAALRGRAGGGEGSRGRAHRNTRSCRTWGTWMPWRESGAERSRAVQSRAVLCRAPRSARPPPIARGGGGRGGAARLASARSGPARPRSRCDPRAAGPSRGRSERPRPGRERGRGCGCRSGRPYARAPATPHSSGSAQQPPPPPPAPLTAPC